MDFLLDMIDKDKKDKDKGKDKKEGKKSKDQKAKEKEAEQWGRSAIITDFIRDGVSDMNIAHNNF